MSLSLRKGASHLITDNLIKSKKNNIRIFKILPQ